MRKTNRKTRALFIAYCAVMLLLLFGRRGYRYASYWEMVRGNLNLTPFHTIRGYAYVLIRRSNRRLIPHAAVNLFGNVFAFVPYGFFLPRLFGRLRRFWRTMLFALVTIACIEAVQLFTLRGSCDIDDLLLNLPGVALGYAAYRIAAARGRADSQ